MGSERKVRTFRKRVLSLEEVSKPCPFQPGSEDKINWMIARLAYNLPLHIQGDFSIPIHPHDKNKNIRNQVMNREIIPDPDEDEDDEDDLEDDI